MIISQHVAGNILSRWHIWQRSVINDAL